MDDLILCVGERLAAVFGTQPMQVRVLPHRPNLMGDEAMFELIESQGKRFNQHIAQGSLFEPEQVIKQEQASLI